MISLLTVSKAQRVLSENLRARRLSMGLTQEGLAKRSGVKLPSLRKFEQKGLISLESFLKLLLVLGCMEEVVAASAPVIKEFSTIEDVLAENRQVPRKKGWRK